MAYIDISGTCNANCLVCPGRPEKPRSGKFMSPPLLEEILKKAISEGFMDRVFWAYLKNEPMLHPDLPEIFEVAKRLGVRIGISSNLIRLPRMTPEMLSSIESFDVSISGFSNETYKRNHRGGDIKKVMSNMLALRDLRDACGQSFPIRVKWHRYRYNEHELEEARACLLSEGIGFSAHIAFWGGAKEFEDHYEGRGTLEGESYIRERIFIEIVDDFLEQHRRSQRCVLKDILSINEYGQALVCCAYANGSDSVLGDYLSLSRDAMQQAKDATGFCAKCMHQGWSDFFAAGI